MKSSADLPPPAIYWREIAGHWLSCFYHRDEVAPVESSREEAAKFVEQIPPPQRPP